MESTPNSPAIIQARVLIVDDDPLLRTQLKHLASRFISEIQVACDGREGLDIWRQWRPDVVVTDILMPVMDGLEMCTAIRAEDADAQIIVISGDQDNAYLRSAMALGVERYISKPVDVHLLVDALRKCLRDQQQREELRLSRQVAMLTQELQLQLKAKEEAEKALQKEKAEQQVLIQRLEEAHNQLLQSEKMASLGQLAAGVAHEINNPVGFVTSNLGSLRHYAESLLGLMAVYDQAVDALPVDAPARVAVAAARKEVDADFLLDDMLDVIKESYDGVSRVRRIVLDLSTFSHAGTGEWLWADINQSLDSTLNLAGHEFKQRITVEREFGSLPEVECHPSQLNQVFLNLIVNAAQAIDGEGTITVRTGSADGVIWVEIADNGKGIPPENLNRIFDPFFTTKAVGVGTGLGLSITYGIVRKHQGRIDVSSEVGKGTTFRVTLPEHQHQEEQATALTTAA